MPIMYQVYSQQRPGRPRWAMGSSAGLLLLTVGLAAALVQYKGRVEDLALKPHSIAGIQMKLPAEWKLVSPGIEDFPRGTLAVANEPGTKGSPGRRLFVFTAQPYPFGAQLAYGMVVARKFVAEVNARSGLVTVDKDEMSIDELAGLPAVTLGLAGGSPLRGGISANCTVRVAIAPNGYVIGTALLSADSRRMTAIRLLDRLGKEIELPGTKPAADPDVAMKAAGIVFRLPAGAKVVEPAVGELPRLRLVGGENTDCWVLDVARTPLIGSRTAEQLLEDYALATLQQAGLENPIESVELNGRKAFRMDLRGTSEKQAFMLAWCIQTAPDTALLLAGRFDSDAGKAVDAVCRSIAGSAEVTDFQQVADIPKALLAGRGRLGRIAAEGLERVWGPLLDEDRQISLHEVPGMTFLRGAAKYSRERRSGKWGIEDLTYTSDDGRFSRLQSKETWAIQDKGNGFSYSFLRTDSSGRMEFKYTESRAAGSNQVSRSLTVPNSGKRQETVVVDEHYGCEPVLLVAGGRVAGDDQSSPAIFMATEMFASRPVYWTMIPMGQRALPWDSNGTKCAAVCLLRDFDPEPIMLYYDREGMLSGIGFDSGGWRRLVRETEGGQAAR